jgi:hypothetical protein
MKQQLLKKSLFAVIMLALWSALIQDNLHLFKEVPLKGAFTSPEDVTFSYKKWFDGEYPEKKTEFIKYNFGFRSDFLRLHNQLKYWLFHSTSESIIIGKENYLYGDYYIDEYYGTNYRGDEKVHNNIVKLKDVQDSLLQRGTLLFVVYAPGKASFYPEYFPDNLKREKLPKTNYSEYISESRKAGLNYIDMRTWFEAMKDTSQYLLFPRGGVHWSDYGDFLAFDSLVKYIEANTQRDLPDIRLDSIALSRKPRRRDYDLGEIMNLGIDYHHDDVLAYPRFSIADSGKQNVSVLSISDSYYYEIFDKSYRYFKEDDFWFYFGDFHSNHGGSADKQDLPAFLSKYNVICMMYTDGSLKNFGSGFIDEAYRQFHLSTMKDKQSANIKL